MACPFYPTEADDPDLDWLVTCFLYDWPGFIPLEVSGLPMMLLPYREPPAKESPDVLQKRHKQDSEP